VICFVTDSQSQTYVAPPSDQRIQSARWSSLPVAYQYLDIIIALRNKRMETAISRQVISLVRSSTRLIYCFQHCAPWRKKSLLQRGLRLQRFLLSESRPTVVVALPTAALCLLSKTPSLPRVGPNQCTAYRLTSPVRWSAGSPMGKPHGVRWRASGGGHRSAVPKMVVEQAEQVVA